MADLRPDLWLAQQVFKAVEVVIESSG